ncbi:TadE/TadG family type IV pilus assembly protein [Faunimonas sp. B44]|uniref:TadE/TadG family type IV pilus assembly protein n=1 Tax=Faunimonas sp. B44 TaxID=3461493 RepID=UPI004044E9FC
MRRWARRISALRTIARRTRESQSGSAAVEFAILAPVFLFLMFVIAQTALIFIAEQVMDNAVADAARLIRTGQVQSSGFSKQDFKDEVCRRMSVFVDCDGPNFYLDVRSYTNFSDMKLDKPVDKDDKFADEGQYSFGAPNEIVVVRAYYQMPTTSIFGGLSLKNMASGKRLIGTTAAFKNEPYAKTAGVS